MDKLLEEVTLEGTVWFTADPHFQHTNIIDFCQRPYKNTDEMDADLIKRWNEVVAPNDWIVVVGDFALGLYWRWPTIIKQLAGKKMLVLGNHDRTKKVMTELGFDLVFRNVILTTEGKRIWLNHFPMGFKRPPIQEQYDLAVCGHVHHNWKVRNGCVNAGVDVWDYKPVRLDQLIEARDNAARLEKEHEERMDELDYQPSDGIAYEESE